MEEDSEFPPGFPNTWNSKDNHRQQVGAVWRGFVSFQAEKKVFYQQEFSGKCKIKEVHRQGEREIVVPINSRQWISNRLRWKCSNPGIYTSRLRLVVEGVSVYITEKSNRWGIYIAIQVKDNQTKSFVILPGGKSGELWGAFASWLCSEGVESRELVARINTPQSIGVSATHSSIPPFHRSYAEAVLGGSLVQNNPVIDSLQKEIAQLKANFRVLSEQVLCLERQLEIRNNGMTVDSRITGGDDDTLVDNTAYEDEVECLNASAQLKDICDVRHDVVADQVVDCLGLHAIATNHLDNTVLVPQHVNHSSSFMGSVIPVPAQGMQGSDYVKETGVADEDFQSKENADVTPDFVADLAVDCIGGNATVTMHLNNRNTMLVSHHCSASPCAGSLVQDILLGAASHVGNAENLSVVHKESGSPESIPMVQDPGNAEEPVVAAIIAVSIPDTTNKGPKRAPTRHVPVIWKNSRSRWQTAWHRIKQRNEDQLCLAWQEITEISRAGNKVDTSNLLEGSYPTAPVNLSDDECEAYISPFQNEEVPGIFNALRDEQERDIAAGINAGYPEFLARIEVGVESIASWLGKLDSCVLSNSKSTVKKLGRKFQWDDYAFHGLTVWTALVPTPIIKTSDFLFPCWKRLIGRPLLEFLDKEGIETSEQWFVDGPPRLSAIFGKARWQFP